MDNTEAVHFCWLQSFCSSSTVAFAGAETDGLPDYAWRSLDAAVVIPIIERHVRSLNVSVAAGIGLYEAIRQIDSLSTSNPEGP